MTLLRGDAMTQIVSSAKVAYVKSVILTTTFLHLIFAWVINESNYIGCGGESEMELAYANCEKCTDSFDC